MPQRGISNSNNAPINGVESILINHEMLFTVVEHTSTAPDQLNTYNIPPGNMPFLDAQFQTTLEADTGSGFQPLVWNTDYVHALRKVSIGTKPSIIDSAIGIKLQITLAIGTLMRLRWKEFRLYMPPPIIQKRADTDGDDYTQIWYSGVNPQQLPPKRIQVGQAEGFQLEFWRETLRTGGKRSTVGGGINNPQTTRRLGRRYLPYYRSAVDLWVVHMDEFTTNAINSKRLKFRVCYYDPSTGARSPLSTDGIMVNRNHLEFLNSSTQRKVRSERSLWIF